MIRPITVNDHSRVIEIWEASVRATHDFLPEDYLQYIKKLLPEILKAMPVFVIEDENRSLQGFLGVAEKKIEMLFLDPQYRGKGIGRQLTHYAIQELGADSVDVNEQNPQAIGFYQRMGFVITGRTETDGAGKPYPILQMTLKVK